MTDPITPTVRHSGIELRETVHASRLEGAQEMRRAQADAKAAIAPALKTMGKPISLTQKLDPTRYHGMVKRRPATRLAD